MRVPTLALLLALASTASAQGQAPDRAPDRTPDRTPYRTWIIGPFTRPLDAPVIRPNTSSTFTDPITEQTIAWEKLHTFNPAATVHDGKVAVLYRAEDDSGTMMVGGHTSRLGLGSSSDGLHFKTQSKPVLYAANDAQKRNESPGGVEDPRIVQSPDGTYIVTYTQYARDRDTFTIGLATSRDLEHWTKHGAIFDSAEKGRYRSLKYKSAGILTKLENGRLVAAKLHGRYWMYWGEITIRLATSSDLIHWTPVLDPATKEPRILLAPRAGHFDSGFPETGPPPLLTNKGIVMLYNAKNAEQDGDPTLAAGTYSVGEALFSAGDPAKLLDRTETPVFHPERDFERGGQYAAGTTFAEGLVPFQGKWFLYYGCADSLVGVATAPMRVQ